MEEKGPEVNNDEKGSQVNKSQNENENENNRSKVTNAGEQEIQQVNFYYLEKRDGEDASVFNGANDRNEDENIFKPHAILNKYAICILLKEDSTEDSDLLKLTLDGIISNFGGLSELGINCENIFIYVFANKIKKNELISQDTINEKLKEENINNYLLSHFKLKDDGRDIKIEVVVKKDFMSDIEALKIFYTEIVKSLKADKTMITSVLTAGVKPSNNALSNLIKICIESNNNKTNKSKKFNNCVTVPALEINENMDKKSDNFFTKLIRYERAHFNIYDMNFYKSAGAVPILSLFNTMTIDKDLMDYLTTFYGTIKYLDDGQLQKLDYHDYKLGLFLYKSNINIEYYSKETSGTIYYKDFDYKYLCASRDAGYYANILDIAENFINFDLPIFHKLFILFQLIGLLIEFIYPGLSILVIYSILVEAFDDKDYLPAWFMTSLYIIMNLANGVSSLIDEKYKNTKITNVICYYFMVVYYLFVIICSIPAMDNIKKQKLFGDESASEYEFNNAAAGCLITFTFIFAIIPMLLRIGMITKNIVPMILYLFLGTPISTSYLLISKIWNAPGASGGKNIDDRKGIVILFFFLFNLFFGFLSAYIYDRELRANCVMGLAIFYLIYLAIKVIGIVLSLISNPDVNKISSGLVKQKLEGVNIFESRKSSDHLNEGEPREENNNETKNENEEENNEKNINNGNEEENRNQNNDDNILEV